MPNLPLAELLCRWDVRSSFDLYADLYPALVAAVRVAGTAAGGRSHALVDRQRITVAVNNIRGRLFQSYRNSNPPVLEADAHYAATRNASCALMWAIVDAANQQPISAIKPQFKAGGVHGFDGPYQGPYSISGGGCGYY